MHFGPTYVLQRINNAVVEFDDEPEQDSGFEGMPVTLENYILGTQRNFTTRFEIDIKMVSEKAFKDVKPGVLHKSGVFTVINNKIWSIKFECKTSQGYKVLSEKYVCKIFTCICAVNIMLWDCCRELSLEVALMCAFCPTKLYSLNLKNVVFTTIIEKDVTRIAGTIGGSVLE